MWLARRETEVLGIGTRHHMAMGSREPGESPSARAEDHSIVDGELGVSGLLRSKIGCVSRKEGPSLGLLPDCRKSLVFRDGLKNVTNS